MLRLKKNIDFELLWKKINSKLSTEEETIFQKWIETNKQNLTYFEKVKIYYKTGKVHDDKVYNIAKSWYETEPRLIGRKIRKMPDWVKMIASVAATVLIMLSIYFGYVEKPAVTVIANKQELVIPPGTSKARLVFDNGKSIELSNDSTFNAEIDGALVSSHGNQISYFAQDNETTEQLQYNTLEIPRGAEYFIVLSDGTKIWLNSDSKLKYPVKFSKTERAVELSGEAYFEVSKDANKPFRVSSGAQIVEVLGTQFNISSYKDEDLIYTTLVEGKVKVFTENNPELTQNLTPGFQTYMYRESGDISIRKVDVSEFTAWKDGEFYFKNKTLYEMMQVLSRWYNIETVFKNEDRKNIHFTGTVKRYENLENMLSLIEKTQEVKFEKTGNQIVVK